MAGDVYATNILELETRNQLIALPQMIAVSIPPQIFDKNEALVILVNGEEDIGKSLIPLSMSAKLLEGITIEDGDLSAETWISEYNEIDFKVHFLNAVSDQLPALPERINESTIHTLRAELRDTADLVFMHNTPEVYRDAADILFDVSKSESLEGGKWARKIRISVLSERLGRDFEEYIRNLNVKAVEAVAKNVPPKYLQTSGNFYEPIPLQP